MFGAAQTQATEDTIIAIVNEDVITYKELHDYLRTIYLQLTSEGRSHEEITKVMGEFETTGMDRLIEHKLLVDEANHKGLTVREKLVDEKLAEIRNQYENEQAFLNSLIAEGLTVTDIKNKIRDQLKTKYIVEMEVKSKIFVNPQEVTDHYHNHLQEFRKPERIDLESIFIPFDGTSKKVAQQKINEVLMKLKKGEDFPQLANAYSNAPSIGIIAKGQLIPSIENAVFGLNEGELSKPLETENGIYLFRAKAKLADEQATLEEVKSDIYEFLFQKKFKEKMNAWLDGLKKKAYIEIKS